MSEDRIKGVRASLAIKAPCRLATTANITLSANQTIDGVATATGDRILVKDQTDTTENGIYAANSSTWTREPDFDGADDVVTGTLVYVTAGSTNIGYWSVSTTGTIIAGTSAIAFAKNSSVLAVVSAFMQTLLDDANAAAALVTLGALGNVSEDASPQAGGDFDMNGNLFQLAKGADVASGAALPVLTDGNYFDVTGAVTITSIDTVGGDGTIAPVIKLHFDGAPLLTHHATNLILPSGANVQAAAGDELEFTEYGSGTWRCTGYTLASGAAIGGGNKIHYLPIRLVEESTNCAAADGIGGDLVMQFDGTIEQADGTPEWLSAASDTAGITGEMVVDVKLNGTSIMTTNKLDILTTEKSSTTNPTQPDLTTTSFSRGDILTFEIVSIHSGTAALGCTVYLKLIDTS